MCPVCCVFLMINDSIIEDTCACANVNSHEELTAHAEQVHSEESDENIFYCYSLYIVDYHLPPFIIHHMGLPLDDMAVLNTAHQK